MGGRVLKGNVVIGGVLYTEGSTVDADIASQIHNPALLDGAKPLVDEPTASTAERESSYSSPTADERAEVVAVIGDAVRAALLDPEVRALFVDEIVEALAERIDVDAPELSDVETEKSAGDDGTDDNPEPPRAGAGATGEAWTVHARKLGLDVPDDAGRDAVIALVDAHKAKK